MIKILKIGYFSAGTFDVIADIEHNAGKKIKDKRETNGEKRGINKKQPDFGYRNMETLAQIGANTKRVSFKKG